MFFGSFRNWLRLLRRNGFDRAYTGRVLFVSLTSLLTAPLRILERLWYGPRIERVELSADPVFIVGYPRSGTTHLHNLLSQDPTFGYVTQLQTLAPEAFLLADRLLRPLLEKFFLKQRPQDNVALSLNAPQEEEHALANIFPHSELHSIFFPRQMQHYVRRYALFEDVPGDVRQAWKKHYRSILKKAAYHMPGRQLLLKTPANVARIPLLLEMFPNAKFIHIYRNPYVVYASHRHTLRVATEMVAVQEIGQEALDANVFEFYPAMLQKFLDDMAQIPAGNLAEIRFEELERAPLMQLARVYQELSLGDFAGAEPHFRAYLETLAGYQKNAYELDPTLTAEIGQRWRFALERWPYHPPAAGGLP